MKISIVMASYNYATLISKAIESILKQTFSNWELVIIDDGSKDNSLDIINSYLQKDDRVKLFTHQDNKNLGLSKTLEFGISKCTGDYIAFLESDDYWDEDCLEKRYFMLKQNNATALIFNDIRMFGEKSEINKFEEFHSEKYNLLKKLKKPAKIGDYFMENCLIPTFSSVMIKKDNLSDINFDSPIDSWLDWWIYAQLAGEKFCFLDEKLTNWYKHHDSYVNIKPDIKQISDFKAELKKFKKKCFRFNFQNISKLLKNYWLFLPMNFKY